MISALAVFPFPNNNNELEASYLHTDGSRFLFCGGYTVKHVTDAHFPASKHNLKITLWRVELQQCVLSIRAGAFLEIVGNRAKFYGT